MLTFINLFYLVQVLLDIWLNCELQNCVVNEKFVSSWGVAHPWLPSLRQEFSAWKFWTGLNRLNDRSREQATTWQEVIQDYKDKSYTVRRSQGDGECKDAYEKERGTFSLRSFKKVGSSWTSAEEEGHLDPFSASLI